MFPLSANAKPNINLIQSGLTSRLISQSHPIKKIPPTVPWRFPCPPVFFCEMQLEKVIIEILLFYLIKENPTLKVCTRCNLLKNVMSGGGLKYVKWQNPWSSAHTTTIRGYLDRGEVPSHLVRLPKI